MARAARADALNEGLSARAAQRAADRKRIELEDADDHAAAQRVRDDADLAQERADEARRAQAQQAAAAERAETLRLLLEHATEFTRLAAKYEAQVSHAWSDYAFNLACVLRDSGFARIGLIEKILWDASH